jgi:threonine dehydrogenase-like Zn-dependent dehydrogenase
MDALLLTASGLHLARTQPIPTPAPDEALIRVRLAGVCSTDIEMTRGYKGGFLGVLGHEFVGEVVASPSDAAWVGRRVVGEINISCGDCAMCRRGVRKHCQRRTALGISRRDGVFAEYVTLPLVNLHAVPDTVADEQAVFVEPLAAAFQVLEQVPIAAASRVYVLGAGRLGLLCAMALATTGCDLTVVGRHIDRLQMLTKLGVANVMLAEAATYTGLADNLADVVVEVTGAAQGITDALRLVRPGGVIVQKSTYAGPPPSFDSNRIVVDEITVVGSRCGPFPRALAALESGAVVVDSLVDARFPLSQGVEALAYAQRPGVLKVLLIPGA